MSKKLDGSGQFPSQYRTMEIESGRDEQEQLIISNVRALFERQKFYERYFYWPLRRHVDALCKRNTHTSAILIIAAGVCAALMTLRKLMRRF